MATEHILEFGKLSEGNEALVESIVHYCENRKRFQYSCMLQQPENNINSLSSYHKLFKPTMDNISPLTRPASSQRVTALDKYSIAGSNKPRAST